MSTNEITILKEIEEAVQISEIARKLTKLSFSWIPGVESATLSSYAPPWMFCRFLKDPLFAMLFTD